jgi:hypothetical protein
MRLSGIVQKMFKVTKAPTRRCGSPRWGRLAMAQSELQQVELVRTGRMFKGGTGIIANAIAPEQAIPTTTALIALFNGEPDGGRTYFIDHLAFSLLSGTAAAGASLFAAVSAGKIASPPSAMATGLRRGSGNRHAEACLAGQMGDIGHLAGRAGVGPDRCDLAARRGQRRAGRPALRDPRRNRGSAGLRARPVDHLGRGHHPQISASARAGPNSRSSSKPDAARTSGPATGSRSSWAPRRRSV